MMRNARLVVRAAAGLLGLGLLAAAGCNALLDIGEIEFGDATGGASAGGGGHGAQTTGGQTTGGQTTGGQTTGGGTTGGNGTGATGGGGGADGGGGSAPCVEICDDGSDNDGNDLADCADPCCQGAGYRCIPTDGFGPPWDGPYVAYVGPGPAPGCPYSWSELTLQGVVGDVEVAGPHTCSGCTCGAPVGSNCSAGSIQFWESANCGGNSPGAQSQGGGCTAVMPGTLPLVSAKAALPTASGGSCTPSGGTPTVPDWSGETEVTVCGAPAGGAGCDANEVCAHVPAGQLACIMRGGSQGCGSFTDYTEVQLIDEVTDSRDCSACSCGTPENVSCSATTTVFSDAGCGTSATSVPNDGTSCVTVSSPPAISVSLGTPTGGSCDPAGGLPTGDLGTTNATLCCLP